jgi:blue copper oxidase
MKLLLLIITFIGFPFLNAQQALQIPPLLEGNEYNLTLQNGSVAFLTGELTQTMGVNGNLLGPTLLMQKGQTVQMNVNNQLGTPTTIHWHGLHVSPSNDGGPHIVIMPNQTWSPSWIVTENAHTSWYHPHLHHHTNEHVQKGIAGLIIVKDENEQNLGLPSTYGVDDFPIVVQTKAFDASNQIIVESALDVNLMVNGTLQPFLDVPAQLVRLRLLNGSSERYYNFGLTNNQVFQMIATEGGLLNQTVPLTRLMLAPGERAEIIVDFSSFEGQTVFLKSFGAELPNAIYGAAQPGMGAGQTIPNYTSNPLNGNDFDVLEFSVGQQTANPVLNIPQVLNSLSPISETESQFNRNLLFQTTVQGPTAIQGPFTINGQLFDMDVIN